MFGFHFAHKVVFELSIHYLTKHKLYLKVLLSIDYQIHLREYHMVSSCDSFRLLILMQVEQDVVAELTKSVEKIGLDMRVTALVSPVWFVISTALFFLLCSEELIYAWFDITLMG